MARRISSVWCRRKLNLARKIATDQTQSDLPPSPQRDKMMASRPHPTIDKMIRVNYAGEHAAVRMCAGIASAAGLTEDIERAQKREKKHAETFLDLLKSRRVRPTLTLPFWDFSGFVLGAVSAAVSEEAARACTNAVEDVINEHYNSQLRQLLSEGIKDDELLQAIIKCRDDELEDIDLDNYGTHVQSESAYEALNQAVKSSCKLAIWMTEQI